MNLICEYTSQSYTFPLISVTQTQVKCKDNECTEKSLQTDRKVDKWKVITVVSQVPHNNGYIEDCKWRWENLLVMTRESSPCIILPDKVSCEKSFSMKVAGALKYSTNSAAVGGGESRWNV